MLIVLILGLITTEKKCKYKKDKIIYLHKGEFHLDIIINVDDIDKNLRQGLNYNEDDKFFAFGWGDKDYFLNKPNFRIILKALFLKSETLIHVTRYKKKNKKWLKIKLCKKQLEILKKYINTSFKLNSRTQKIVLKNESFYNHDEFYKSKGSYSCFKTCNTWVGKALKKAGFRTPVWTPFQYGITRNFEYLEKNHQIKHL